MRILFVARTYPPLIGGMEKFAWDFYENLRPLTKMELLANKNGKKAYIFFMVRIFFYLLKNARKFDIIHFSDATLSIIFPIIKMVSKAKITLTVHGLDVVYNKFGYQLWTPIFLRLADKVFPVSHYTQEKCMALGIPTEKLKVIPNGLNGNKITECQETTNGDLLNRIGIDLRNKTILLTIGRLVKRKGHNWFIRNVFTKLPDRFV
jgi:glycosyltransferase involved in cell wall biosynthesis